MRQGIGVTQGRTAAFFLAVVAVSAAYALAPFANEKPAVAVAVAMFPVLLIVLLGLPAFQCLRLGPRMLLILLTLRPLLDVSAASFETASRASTLRSSTGLSLQEGFAAIFGILMLVVWVTEHQPRRFRKFPDIFLTVLLGLTTFSWLMGGLGEGARGCVRTAWGLVVGLLLGSLFHTEKQIDTFIRAVFYSSFLVLVTLSLNLNTGDVSREYWRLGGQYGSGNALAGVVFSFFLCGLYVFGSARALGEKLLSVVLLALLGTVIFLTQSRTVGGLMLLSVCLYLWANRRRWLLLGIAVPLLLLLFLSTAGTGWRLVASFSSDEGEASATVLTLTGRVALWTDWLHTYLDASLFQKIFGLGWGPMLRHYLAMPFFRGSITENSFLWFLIGAGVLGLLAFCAYLFWVLFKAWGAWRRADSSFEKRFALLTFLTAFSFVVEGFTTDVASAPNANVYLFAVMSMFVFQWFRNPAWRSAQAARSSISQVRAENAG